jgi:uncharacterized protein (TIGR03435 family)
MPDAVRTILRMIAGLASIALMNAQPAFEVASIKPNLSGSQAMLFLPAPGRFDAENQTLQHLLMRAYDVKDFQMSGGPGWINSDHYDIQAKAEGNPSPDQMRLMLQTLLRERFKLALHRETKELPIYALTVAKGGLKLQPPKEGSCISPDPNNPSVRTPGQKQSDFCGFGGTGRGTLDATSATMTHLAGMFSLLLDRVVVDKTGIAGEFRVHLTFAPDEVATGLPAASDAGPSLFTAVQEQLGLKLESTRGPVEVLVIDQMERPSEN